MDDQKAVVDPFGGLMAPWQNAQQPMLEVIRWSQFPSYGQTLVEHNSSLPLVVLWVQSRLIQYEDIDWALLFQTAAVHDHGEPLTGGDENEYTKTPDKERREYEAFSQLISGADQNYRNLLMKAFLLPYVRKQHWWPSFLEADRVMVQELAGCRGVEALLFEAVERLDYLASAVMGHRQGIRNDRETMIDHVLGNQVPKLDRLAVEYRPFAEYVWTPRLRELFLALGSG